MQPSTTPGRPSGIPRPISRIPLPTQIAVKTIKPSPSREKLQADTGLDHRRLRRPSQENLTRRLSSQHLRRRESSQTLYSFIEDAEPSAQGEDENETAFRGRTGTLRPISTSLSDRTIESLSRVPPSPSPHGRQTLNTGLDTSMGPPLQPPSPMKTQTRSPSRSSPYLNFEDGDSLASPTTRRASSRLSSVSISSREPLPPRKSSTSSESSKSASKTLGGQSLGSGKRSSIAGSLTSQRGDTLPARSAKLSGSSSETAKSHAKPRLSLSGAFTKPSQDEEVTTSFTVKKKRQTPSNISSNMTSPSSIASKNSSYSSDQAADADTELRKVSKSSNALRESIAKARAAKKATRKSNVNAAVDPWDNIEIQDPFGQCSKDGNKAVLQKRVDGARKSGSLNIAALGLTTLPEEVLKMYEYDPNSNSNWFENVDLVKFIAADNELAQLPDAAFPDVDPQDFDMDDESQGNQFGGLEFMDLHGNCLQSLPIGLRRLQRLTSLNLSNNRFKMQDIEVVQELRTLTDLKLANNNLEGQLLSGLCCLPNLEILDLHGNQIKLLPDHMSELKSLKTLNLSDNELDSLPSSTLSKLPLVELDASRNKLQGVLMTSTTNGFRNLQTLNVAFNGLERLSEDDAFNLPNLQFLLVDANRLKCLPSLGNCRSLLRISAEGNLIKALPDGFLDLKNLKHVDMTANDLSKLDERIGLMNNLVTFCVANNPLRERKFLTMDTEDLKNDLRNRCAPMSDFNGATRDDEATIQARSEAGDEDEEGSVATEFTLAPESPSHLNRWKVKSGGILDRSETEMTELDAEEVKPLVSNYDIRCLYLQRNKLQTFPIPALNLISATLVDLDLSKNPMVTDRLFSEAISLPQLQSLTLNGCGLASVDSLLENLSAPSLKFLDISNNRLVGSLPPARQHYTSLSTYLVSDNQLTSLEFESVNGLQVLDISNNNIDFLPPKIGLLGGPDGAGLKRFEVAGNTFRVPRWQIVQKGTEAVLEWLKGRIPVDELNEVESN